MDHIGRFQIIGELGRGAMGVVYRAQDPAIGRVIAIKTIRLSDLTDPAERERLRERLFREAQSAGILSHPNIVTIYDVAEENEMAYIFMELVNGPTLDNLLAKPEAPEKELLLSIFRQTAGALDYAHRKGIVHRDIKPANIMIHDDGQAKVTDFGVAKIVSQQMTQTGVMMGTPNYMSPEQIQGHSVDGRADQFALAVIAYEVLTGEKPFTADYLPTLLYKIVKEDPVAPQRLNPTLGPAVETVLRKALSKDPAERYGSCTEFLNALGVACNSKKGWQPLPHGASQNMPTVAGTAAGTATPAPAIPPRRAGETVSRPVPREPRRGGEHEKAHPLLRTLIWILAGIGIVGAMLLGAQKLLFHPEEPAHHEAAAAQTPEVPEPSKPSPAPAPQGAENPPGPPAENPASGDSGSKGVSRAEAPRERPTPEGAAPAPGNAGAHQTVQLLTDPPGAEIVVDGKSDLNCKSPCMLPLPNGRHTLVANLEGYRTLRRVFNSPQDKDLLSKMQRQTGTLHVTSDPPGATILLNGEEQKQKTPATMVIPAGSYKLQLAHEGKRWEGQIEIRDGEFKTVEW